MDYIRLIENFAPANEQEESDKRITLRFIEQFPSSVLLRENEIAHITSSAFVVNQSCDKALLVHHNIMNTWAWPGGHADGDADLMRVARREVREETGVCCLAPLLPGIASVDILPVHGHIRNGEYVSAHLHLSVAYIVACDDKQPLSAQPGENTAVQWFGFDQFTGTIFSPQNVYFYNKLINRARSRKS